MYIHIGYNEVLPLSAIIAIVAYSGEVDTNLDNQHFLQKVRERGNVIDIAGANVKSMILADDDQVYLSPISPITLKSRSKKNGLPGGNEIN